MSRMSISNSNNPITAPRFNEEQESENTRSLEFTRLKGGRSIITKIAVIRDYQLFVVSCADRKVRVYDFQGGSEPRVIFSRHSEAVSSVVHLKDDIVATASAGGLLLTWHANTGAVVDVFWLPAHLTRKFGCFTAASKVNDCAIAVGTELGRIIIVSHEDGNNLNAHHCLHKVYTLRKNLDAWIWDIVVRGDVMVTVANNYTATIWSTSTFLKMKVLSFDEPVYCAAISDEHIFIAGGNGVVHMFGLKGCFEQQSILHSSLHPIYAMALADQNALLVAGASKEINLISLREKKYSAKVTVKKSRIIESIEVLNENSFVVGTRRGYTAVTKLPTRLSSITQSKQPVYSAIGGSRSTSEDDIPFEETSSSERTYSIMTQIGINLRLIARNKSRSFARRSIFKFSDQTNK